MAQQIFAGSQAYIIEWCHLCRRPCEWSVQVMWLPQAATAECTEFLSVSLTHRVESTLFARELERHLRGDKTCSWKILLGRPEWRIYVDEQVFKV